MGAGGAKTTVSPITVINFNNLGNDNSSMNVGDRPRVSSKLMLLNAYASKLTVNKSGSYIFKYYSSITRYMVTLLTNLMLGRSTKMIRFGYFHLRY
jgi:hypothetical protein